MPPPPPSPAADELPPIRSYIITTPRQWIPGEKNQVCVNVPDTTAEAGVITLYMRTTDYNWQGRRNVTILPETTFEIPAGQIEACQQVTAPRRSDYHADLSLTGRVGGADLKETLDIDLKGTHNLTIIQTDKFLYEPGQEVKFRVLTIHGSMGQREIYDPRRPRWACGIQWAG
ncbi:alpha-2-macroglobulin [Penaeus vannamei]|uniref:Alpha-2-macroglobulin n=1 Tax=Penaeus vannamei TaxID=6689 RepID=A0A3R7N6I9_PENVA|nr:alpha-2-macroglobulin [Penaeus vannamei]